MTKFKTLQNVCQIEYPANGESVRPNPLGMRPMQARVYARHAQQYLLVKSPPASGKSRALMYVALEKLKTKSTDKVIVSVPERSIGKSFANTVLVGSGFHSDWVIDPKYDLCSPGVETGKVAQFIQFLKSDAQVLLCTHSTLRSAFGQLEVSDFDRCLIAIDEFHHVSVQENNQLGTILRKIMRQSSAHIMAMTGSYFRGDSNSILSPDDESKFVTVTYNYYEQLSGYQHLKSLGISFAFYQGIYTDAIKSVLDSTKKTIIHIPSVNSAESPKEKYREVDQILEVIGSFKETTEDGIFILTTADGRELRVADLVNDDMAQRERVVSYLRRVAAPDDIDIIIALGMAKEGFDWPFCEVALTVGYRGSLTEIVQIVGRTTRDSPNKSHAQFINLVAEPDETRGEVVGSVNNIFKAIAASLLMEDVLVPRLKISADIGSKDLSCILVRGFREPPSQRVRDIVEDNFVDLKAQILQNPDIQKSLAGGIDAHLVNSVLIPRIVREIFPDLEDEEVESVSDHVITRAALRDPQIEIRNGQRLIKVANKFVNVDDLNIELVYSVNPFEQSYEVISKQLSEATLKAIQNYIIASRIDVTDDEAVKLWPEVQDFYRIQQREPSRDSLDPHEKRLSEILAYLRKVKNAQ